MRLLRVFAPVLIVTAFGLGACSSGGSSAADSSAPSESTPSQSAPSESAPSESAPSESSGSSAPSASIPSVGGNASDAKFCQVFTTLSTALSTAVSEKDGAAKLKQLADNIESAAPSSIKADAKNLANAYRSIADAINKNGDTTPSFNSDTTKSITNIAVWSASHCSR